MLIRFNFCSGNNIFPNFLLRGNEFGKVFRWPTAADGVIVGKALSEGKVEFRVRKSGEKQEVALASAVSSIAELLK